MEQCLFCAVQQGAPAGDPIYQDKLVYAYHYRDGDGEQMDYLGHLLLITRRHTPDFASLTPAEAQAVGLLITRLSDALKVSAGAEKVYTVFYGEVTPHLHVHLTARYPETPPQYLRWNVEDWPDAPRGDADAIAALCHRMRAALARDPAAVSS